VCVWGGGAHKNTHLLLHRLWRRACLDQCRLLLLLPPARNLFLLPLPRSRFSSLLSLHARERERRREREREIERERESHNGSHCLQCSVFYVRVCARTYVCVCKIFTYTMSNGVPFLRWGPFDKRALEKGLLLSKEPCTSTRFRLGV
jgi:hypothetical protein